MGTVAESETVFVGQQANKKKENPKKNRATIHLPRCGATCYLTRFLIIHAVSVGALPRPQPGGLLGWTRAQVDMRR